MLLCICIKSTSHTIKYIRGHLLWDVSLTYWRLCHGLEPWFCCSASTRIDSDSRKLTPYSNNDIELKQLLVNLWSPVESLGSSNLTFLSPYWLIRTYTAMDCATALQKTLQSFTITPVLSLPAMHTGVLHDGGWFICPELPDANTIAVCHVAKFLYGCYYNSVATFQMLNLV